MLKTTSIIVAAMTLLITSIGTAQALDFDLNGSLGLTSDYVFRGASQSNGDMALQGSLEAAFNDNVYARVWGSNVNFGETGDVNGASLEVDTTVGFRNTVFERLSYDAGWIGYWYPGADSDLNYDYHEFFGRADYAFDYLTVGGSVSYSPNYFGDTGKSLYYLGEVSFPLIWEMRAGGSIGYLDYSDSALEDTADYRLFLTKDFGNASVTGNWYDNDADQNYANSDFLDQRWTIDFAVNF